MSTLKETTFGNMQRVTGQGHTFASMISHICELAKKLGSDCDDELRSEAVGLCAQFSRNANQAAPEILVAGTALAVEALRRAHGIQRYDVQLLAVLNLAQGRITQMQTGEGKTFVAIATATHLALAGRGVGCVHRRLRE